MEQDKEINGVPILQWKENGNSNLQKWDTAVKPYLIALFGESASFLDTGDYFKPETRIDDEIPKGEEYQNLDSAKKKFYNQIINEIAKQQTKIIGDKPKIFAELERTLSKD